MELETQSWIIIVLLLLMMAAMFSIGQNILSVKANMNTAIISETLDSIYEHCVEEQNLSIWTMKGRNTKLEIINGRCVISENEP